MNNYEEYNKLKKEKIKLNLTKSFFRFNKNPEDLNKDQRSNSKEKTLDSLINNIGNNNDDLIEKIIGKNNDDLIENIKTDHNSKINSSSSSEDYMKSQSNNKKQKRNKEKNYKEKGNEYLKMIKTFTNKYFNDLIKKYKSITNIDECSYLKIGEFVFIDVLFSSLSNEKQIEISKIKAIGTFYIDLDKIRVDVTHGINNINNILRNLSIKKYENPLEIYSINGTIFARQNNEKVPLIVFGNFDSSSMNPFGSNIAMPFLRSFFLRNENNDHYNASKNSKEFQNYSYIIANIINVGPFIFYLGPTLKIYKQSFVKFQMIGSIYIYSLIPNTKIYLSYSELGWYIYVLTADSNLCLMFGKKSMSIDINIIKTLLEAPTSPFTWIFYYLTLKGFNIISSFDINYENKYFTTVLTFSYKSVEFSIKIENGNFIYSVGMNQNIPMEYETIFSNTKSRKLQNYSRSF